MLIAALWRDYTIALLTRYSTSPDIDLRQFANLSLGYNIAMPANRRFIWQADALNKQETLKLTDAEFDKQTALLPK